MKNGEETVPTEAFTHLLLRHIKLFRDTDPKTLLNNYNEQSELIPTKKYIQTTLKKLFPAAKTGAIWRALHYTESFVRIIMRP